MPGRASPWLARRRTLDGAVPGRLRPIRRIPLRGGQLGSVRQGHGASYACRTRKKAAAISCRAARHRPHQPKEAMLSVTGQDELPGAAGSAGRRPSGPNANPTFRSLKAHSSHMSPGEARSGCDVKRL